MDDRKIKEVDAKLSNLSKNISFFMVNPINLKGEEKKFYSGKDYNPWFKYEKHRTNLDLLQKKLESLKPDSSIIGRILEEKRLRHIKRVLMLKNIGKEKFTECSINLYGKPSKEIVKKAKRLINRVQKDEKERVFNTEEVVSLLRGILDKNNLGNWKIIEREMPAAAAVKQAERTLLIKRGEEFSQEIINRLITHEIGTHILRVENGAKQPFKIFERGLPGYLKTEEGLAVINEEANGHLNKGILANYAARVIAVDMAQKASFAEVFKHMSQYFDAKMSFKFATRVKRGVSDTSNPGGLTKDYLYLEGYFAVKEFIEGGGDIKDLYYGRIGIEHVQLLRYISGLKKPKTEIEV